jgi:hypothetical protein
MVEKGTRTTPKSTGALMDGPHLTGREIGAKDVICLANPAPNPAFLHKSHTTLPQHKSSPKSQQPHLKKKTTILYQTPQD